MSSGYFIDSEGNYDKSRDRHDILADFRLHEWIKDDLGGDFSCREDLVEGLSDDIIYFVDKDYYHTLQNVDPGKASKIGAGPDGRGKAGDLDVGKIEIPRGKITKVELKSPGRIPPVHQRALEDSTYETIKKAHDQNEYLGELLEIMEASYDTVIPYSSRVEAWNDVVNDSVRLEEFPAYSTAGTYICTPEAERKAMESEKIQDINEGLFRGWMLGGGENILENMDRLLEE